MVNDEYNPGIPIALGLCSTLLICFIPHMVKGYEKFNEYSKKINNTPKVWIGEKKNTIRGSPKLSTLTLMGYDYDKDGLIDKAKNRWNMGPGIPMGGWEEVRKEEYKFKALQEEYINYLNKKS